MTKAWRATWLVLVTSFRVSPVQSLVCLAETVARVLQLLQPLYLAWFVTGAIEHNADRVTLAATAFVGSLGLRWILQMLGIHARINQLDRVGFAFDRQIAAVTAEIATLDHLESPEYLDELQTLRDQQGALGGALNALLNLVNNLVFVGGTLILAGTADWRLLLVALGGLPTLIVARWTTRWQAGAERAAAEPGRLAAHLLGLGSIPAAGAELRIFGVAGELRSRLTAAATAWRAPMVAVARRQGAVEMTNALVFFAIAAGVLAWMTHDALQGTIRLSALVLAIMLVNRLQALSTSLHLSAQNAGRLVRTAGRFSWLLQYAAAEKARNAGQLRAPHQLSRGIRLERLSFRYPGSDVAVLDDVTLDLPAGSVVALVGENGAGKSTVVKLLTAMYRPTNGRVLIEGADLADFDPADWRTNVSATFQDYERFEFTARETVGIGDIARVNDTDRVGQALTAAAAEDVLTALPDGLDTQLGTTWPAGVELSGGQWQRLALGRGMMRSTPLLLVLDEPTGALDATTEHSLFQRYAAAARAGRKRGTITLLVTHRFSTAAAADRIVVLDHGAVAEQGTHAELIATGGRYAELYRLQAHGYR